MQFTFSGKYDFTKLDYYDTFKEFLSESEIKDLINSNNFEEVYKEIQKRISWKSVYLFYFSLNILFALANLDFIDGYIKVVSDYPKIFYGFDNLIDIDLSDKDFVVKQKLFLVDSCENLISIKAPGCKKLYVDDCKKLNIIIFKDTTLDYFFSNLPALSKIEISETHPTLCSIDNVIYSKDKKTLEYIPQGYSGVLNIEEGVTSIKSAFSYCLENRLFITEIHFPNSLSLSNDVNNSWSDIKAFINSFEGVSKITYEGQEFNSRAAFIKYLDNKRKEEAAAKSKWYKIKNRSNYVLSCYKLKKGIQCNLISPLAGSSTICPVFFRSEKEAENFLAKNNYEINGYRLSSSDIYEARLGSYDTAFNKVKTLYGDVYVQSWKAKYVDADKNPSVPA